MNLTQKSTSRGQSPSLAHSGSSLEHHSAAKTPTSPATFGAMKPSTPTARHIPEGDNRHQRIQWKIEKICSKGQLYLLMVTLSHVNPWNHFVNRENKAPILLCGILFRLCKGLRQPMESPSNYDFRRSISSIFILHATGQSTCTGFFEVPGVFPSSSKVSSITPLQAKMGSWEGPGNLGWATQLGVSRQGRSSKDNWVAASNFLALHGRKQMAICKACYGSS